MPLFFAISGASTFYALKPGGGWAFIKSRTIRILFPLVIVGTFLVNPVYVYAIRKFTGQTDVGFFQWYPDFFNGLFGLGGNYAPLGHGTHLWYLEFLFIFSLILLPFFIRSKKRIAAGLNRLSNRFESPVALLLLFLPLSVVGAFCEAIGLGGIRVMGGWDPVSYLLFFAYGYMIYSNGRIQEMIHRVGPVFLIGAVILSALQVDSHFGFNLIITGVTRHDMSAGGASLPLNHFGWAAVQAYRGLVAWCLIIGLLGTASRLLNFSNKALNHANEAVLPFYILHHSIILLVGGGVVQWTSGVGTKYLVIAAVSFVIIMAVYELLIRPVNIARILFGMKIKNESPKLKNVLCVMAVLFLVLVIVLAVAAAGGKVSPPPAKAGLYINQDVGFQLTFPESMNKPGQLGSGDTIFHVRHPEKTFYLKIRQGAIPSGQPLDPQAAQAWVLDIMKRYNMQSPKVLKTEIMTTPDGTKVLYAAIKFKTKSESLFGAYTFVDRNGKRLFIAGYNEGGLEPLEQIMKSLTFKPAP